MNSTKNKATVTGREPSGGFKQLGAIMKQKSITRNDLLLTQDYEESFHDAALNSEVTIRVEEGDGECCSIRVFDDRIDDCGDCVSLLLDRSDAERFAQSILLHSGARKVTTGLASVLQFSSSYLDEVIDEFYGPKLVVFNKENNCYEFPQNDYWIPADDFNNAKLAVGWFAHLSEKSWVTSQHINHLANLIRDSKDGM